MSIQNELDKIKNAVYGVEVRGAIHDGIKKAYDDASKNGNANMEVEMARGTYPTLNERLDGSDENQLSTNQQIESKLANKITRNNGEIGNADLSQELKESLTQGNVGVVGKDSVSKINIVDNSVGINEADNALSKEIGLKKVNTDWVIGALQGGNINPLATNAVTISTQIQNDNDIVVNFSSNPNFKYLIYQYSIKGAPIGDYNGSFRGGTGEVIPKENPIKIRVSIKYTDGRLIKEADLKELISNISIHKRTNQSNDYLDKRILNLEGKSALSSSIPEYWLNQLNNKVNIINGYQKNLGWESSTFLFITDMHWNDNAKNSPELVKYVVDKCNIPYVLDGGDFVANPLGVSKADHLKEIVDLQNRYKPIENRMLRTLGNHDDNSINKKFSMTFDAYELYDAVYRPYAKYNQIVKGKTGKYSFIDDNMGKVRYISLDSLDIPYIKAGEDGLLYSGMTNWAFRKEQLDWFANVALRVPSSEWGVVVMSHIPINYGYIKNDALAMNILQAFKEKKSYVGSANLGTDFEASVSVDYSDAGGDVFCWMTGHLHEDVQITLPENITYKQIATLNDSLNVNSGQATKTKGTDTEQAFDVVTINRRESKLHLTRIGAGSDRLFNY